MTLIDKDALAAEIEKLIDEIYAGRPFDSLSSEQQTSLWYVKSVMSSVNTIEVKEVQEEPVSEDLEGVTWNKDRIFPKDVEYTRTDAFIEKACSWLSNMSLEDMEYKYDNFDTSEGWYKMIEEFRKYMEGE